MKIIKRTLCISIIIFACIASIGFAEDLSKKIEVTFRDIKLFIDGDKVEVDAEPFIYKDRVFVPVRFVSEDMGGQISWNGNTNTVDIKSYVDFPECDYLKGEMFVYGLITDIDYGKGKITIEQHFDDNSVDIKPSLKLKEDVIIILQRNNKKMNLEISDLKIGEDVGLILNSDNLVRGIVLDK